MNEAECDESREMQQGQDEDGEPALQSDVRGEVGGEGREKEEGEEREDRGCGGGGGPGLQTRVSRRRRFGEEVVHVLEGRGVLPLVEGSSCG
jgi:hypothetical protein